MTWKRNQSVKFWKTSIPKTRNWRLPYRGNPQIEKLVADCAPHETRRTHLLHGCGYQWTSGRTRRFGNSTDFRYTPTLVGLIAGGDTALRNPVENAEDDIHRGWEELTERNITDKDTVIGIAASVPPLRDWCHARGTRTRHTDRLYHQQPGLSMAAGRCSHRNDCRGLNM